MFDSEDDARSALRIGDRLRVPRCPGELCWFEFAGWDGHWIKAWPLWDNRLRMVDDVSWRQISEWRGQADDLTERERKTREPID